MTYYFLAFPLIPIAIKAVLTALSNPQILAMAFGITAAAGGFAISILPGYLDRRAIEKALREETPIVIDNTPNQANTRPNGGVNVRPNGGVNTRPSDGTNRRQPNVKPVPPGTLTGGGSSGTGGGDTTNQDGDSADNTKSKHNPSDRDKAYTDGQISVNTGRTSISYAVPIAIAGELQGNNNPRIIPNPFNFPTDNPEEEEYITELQQQIEPFPDPAELQDYSANFPPDSNTPTDTPTIVNPPSSGFIPANPIPTRKHTWIAASHSTFSKTKGRTITPPVINKTIEWTGTPVDANGSFDATELNQMIDVNSKADKFFDYFLKAKAGQITPEDEQNLDITDIAVTIMPKFLDSNSGLTPIFGVTTILKIAELFSIYSDTAISPVQFNAPLQTIHKFWKHGEYQSNVAIANPMIKDYLKPQDPAFQEKIKDGILLNDGQVVELDPSVLMTWIGNTNLFEGGEEEQEKEYTNVDDFLNSPYLKSPDITEILNGEYDPDTKPDQLKLRQPDQPAKIKVKTHADVTQQMLGVMHSKLGLDQFPAKVPSLIDPPYVLQAEDKRKYDKPAEIQLPNLASGMAYGTAKLDKSIGQFPLELETETPAGSASHAYMPNMANSIGQLTALTMATAAISQFNMNMGLKNTRTLTETRSAAIKGMNCSCANLDFSGANTNPVKRCTNTQWNMRNAKGFNDMATPKADQCDIGLENKDSTSIKKYLTDILFGVNIIKGAFFKGSKELDQQIESIKDINKDIKAKDKKFDDFVEEFNKGRNELTKPETYPAQPKIIIEPKQPNPPTP